jgi:hypothetical protein
MKKIVNCDMKKSLVANVVVAQLQEWLKVQNNCKNHSYDILGAGMLWKPKDLHKIP